MPLATSQPTKSGGFYGGFSPDDTFGTDYGQDFNPFTGVGAGENRRGAGAYGLPRSYSGWNAGARAAVPVAAGYERELTPLLQYLKGEMGRDMAGDLFSESADTIDANLQEGRRLSENEMTKGGYRGASAQSPFAALQLQLESAARAGALGTASRQSVLAAQERKLRIGGMFQNTLASLAQAWMAPSQMQAAASTKSPVGSVGPSYIPSIVQAGAGLISAGAGP